MDRFESMSVFLATVQGGSLSAAGRRLGMPLATVSRKLSELESHLGTRLVLRSTRNLRLTDAGQLYLTACRRILEEVEEAERVASGEYRAPKGDLIVTAPIVFGRMHVLPIVIDFLKAYPEIDIRMLLTDRVVNQFEERVDLSVRIGALPDSSLVATRVGAIRQVLCASPAYFAARGVPKRPAELATHDCITFDGLASADGWRFAKRKADVPIHSRLVVSTAEAAIEAAIAGLGVTRVLSYQVADAVRAGSLVMALQDFEPPPWPVSLVFSRERLAPLKLRAFVDFAAPRLKGALPRIAQG